MRPASHTGVKMFLRTFLPAFVFALTLTACQSIGISDDPERAYKSTIVATSLAVDAVAVYGTLPVCGSGIGDMCQKPKAYRDAKLLTQSFAATLRATERPSVFLTAGLLYYQWQLARMVGGDHGPTNPEAAPSDAVVRQLQALQMADVLVATFDERVRDAASVNTSTADLLADLELRVKALP